MTDVIRAEGLIKKFRSVEALRGLDLTVPEGAIYAMVGPNGAGKTTAITILMNILQPSSGRAEVLGFDSRQIAGRAFCSIGYVSENQDLPGWMRVGDFLNYLRGFYPTWDTTFEAELVKRFDLPLDRKLKSLSRGMRMKAALTSSLAFRPKLLVMDEPFSGLDPLVRDELIRGMLERAEDSSMLISSHDLAEIESFASHIGYIEQGRMLFAEEMNSLIARFRQVEVVLDVPASIPSAYPKTWIQIESSQNVVRFIDSRHEQEGSDALIHQNFNGIREVNLSPMSLREIFVSVARKGNSGEMRGVA